MLECLSQDREKHNRESFIDRRCLQTLIAALAITFATITDLILSWFSLDYHKFTETCMYAVYIQLVGKTCAAALTHNNWSIYIWINQKIRSEIAEKDIFIFQEFAKFLQFPQHWESIRAEYIRNKATTKDFLSFASRKMLRGEFFTQSDIPKPIYKNVYIYIRTRACFSRKTESFNQIPRHHRDEHIKNIYIIQAHTDENSRVIGLPTIYTYISPGKSIARAPSAKYKSCRGESEAKTHTQTQGSSRSCRECRRVELTAL